MNDLLEIAIRSASGAFGSQESARRALACMDLTSLGLDDTDEKIIALCKRANTPAGHTAAVCVYDKFVPLALEQLAGTPVRVATVCNFPEGGTDVKAVRAEAKAQVAAGAHEVDVVLPYKAYMAGDKGTALAVVEAARKACGKKAQLKVILETGELKSPELIDAASRDVIRAGADFIKTSTGKVAVGATLEAAAIMLNVISEMQPEIDRELGFKPAGGIGSVDDAAKYLDLADAIMGPDWATPKRFRFGASSLLNSVLEMLGVETEDSDSSGY